MPPQSSGSTNTRLPVSVAQPLDRCDNWRQTHTLATILLSSTWRRIPTVPPLALGTKMGRLPKLQEHLQLSHPIELDWTQKCVGRTNWQTPSQLPARLTQLLLVPPVALSNCFASNPLRYPRRFFILCRTRSERSRSGRGSPDR